MAQLANVFKGDYELVGVNQVPLYIDNLLAILIDMDSEYAVLTGLCPSKEELSKFVNKFKLLNKAELGAALAITKVDFLTAVSRMVTCIGCRKNVEGLYSRMVEWDVDAFHPFYIDDSGWDDTFRLIEEKCDILSLWNLFYNPSSLRKNMLDSLSKSKRGRRCEVHSLEAQRTRAVTSWVEVWDRMGEGLQHKSVVIDNAVMTDILDQYLITHKFCCECKLKVLKAYSILLGDTDGSMEIGYDPDIYEGVVTCKKDHHIHVAPSASFVTSLITKCIPELSGNANRERHAKTLDIAQEEVLICLGVCLFERLHRIQQRFCAEERAWEIIMCVGATTMRQNFELAVEKKLGASHLDLLCQELEEIDSSKQKGKKTKKSNKKKKGVIKDENRENVIPETPAKGGTVAPANNANKKGRDNKNTKAPNPNKPKEIPIRTSGKPSRGSPGTGIDHGYLSGNNSLDNPSCSSPEGSETLSSVGCSPKPYQLSSFVSECGNTTCTPILSHPNYALNTLASSKPYRSLEEQLEDFVDDDDYEIPEEEVATIQEPNWVRLRAALREDMRLKFVEFMQSRKTAYPEATQDCKPILQSTSSRSNARRAWNGHLVATVKESEGVNPQTTEQKPGDGGRLIPAEKENKKSDRKNVRSKKTPPNPSSGHSAEYCSRRYKGKNRR